MKTYLKLFIVIFFITTKLNAQINWQQTNGPYGGLVSKLVKDKNTGDLFGAVDFDHRKVGGSGGNLYRSTDNGLTWFKVDAGLKAQRITQIAIDPINPAKIYISVSDTLNSTLDMHIYSSTDTGNTWTMINDSTFIPGSNGNYISSLVADPLNNSIYAGRNKSGVHKSLDDGATWTTINTGLTDTVVRTLCLGYQGKIYAATATVPLAGVYSYNGTSWTSMPGLPGNIVSSLAYYAPTGTMYAGIVNGSTGSVYKSVNGGNWTIINGYSATGGDGVFKVAVTSTGELFAVTLSQGIYKFDGTNWSAMNNGLSALSTMSFWQMVIDAADNLLVTDKAGILKMPSTGIWSRYNGNLLGTTGRCFVENALGEIILGTDNGIFSSADGGTSWNFEDLADKNIFTVGLNPFTGTLFAGRHLGTTGGTIFRSTDNGQTWLNTQTGFTGQAAVSFDYDLSGKLYLGTGWGAPGKSIYTTIDDGINWVSASSLCGLPNGTVSVGIAVNKTTNEILLGLEQSGIYNSTNGGLNYNQFGTFSGGDIGQVGISPQGDIYASHLVPQALCGLYRYKKYNSTWTTSPVYSAGFVNCFLIASDDSIYIGTNNGIFLSTDTCVTWTAINNGLDNKHIHSLFLASDNYLYTGVGGGGVYKSDVKIKGNPSTVSIKELKNELKIYPNPSSGIYNFKLEENLKGEKISIYNLEGQLVQQTTISNQNFTIDLLENHPGIYFYTIQSKDKIITGKLILTK